MNAAARTDFPAQAIKLYRSAISGHCHRVELFLSLLGLPFELIDIDLAAGTHKTPAFLAMNDFGQVPVIQDGEVTLADSNAILVYLNGRYAGDADRWLPCDPLAFGPAAARVIQLFKRPDSPEAIARAHALFEVMERQLGQSAFLAGSAPTLADIANYSYAARAPEGKVSLDACPKLRAWLVRIEALPRFVPMVQTPIGLAA
jgi:glutathione S-transferase